MTWTNSNSPLKRARQLADQTGGGILVITEGVYGMAGDLGDLKGILSSRTNTVSVS